MGGAQLHSAEARADVELPPDPELSPSPRASATAAPTTTASASATRSFALPESRRSDRPVQDMLVVLAFLATNAHLGRVRHRNGGEECLRVLDLRVLVDRVRVALLADLPEVHHGDPIAHSPDDSEIVSDEQVRKPELLLQVLEQVEDLRLDRDVERRDGLVTHDQLRVQGECARDADALALPAGELVRVAIDEVGAEPDRVEQPLRGLAPRFPCPELVDDERLGNDVADRHPRIERRVGILEDDLELPADLA